MVRREEKQKANGKITLSMKGNYAAHEKAIPETG
jgi:hypothetical protein